MASFSFHEDLFVEKARAQEALRDAGFNWFEDYQSIDLLHEEYGLEVCGIQEKKTALAIKKVMQKTFRKWWYSDCHYKDFGMEIGWEVIIQKKPFDDDLREKAY